MEEYAAVVPGDFTFTCKAPLDISLTVLVNVNNHYEGSAPRSIERLKGFLLDD